MPSNTNQIPRNDRRTKKTSELLGVPLNPLDSYEND